MSLNSNSGISVTCCIPNDRHVQHGGLMQQNGGLPIILNSTNAASIDQLQNRPSCPCSISPPREVKNDSGTLLHTRTIVLPET